jgi:hypothetical protein
MVSSRNVVEPSGRIVRRQQRRDVDLKIQQVADGVGVFGAVETVQHHRTRIRVRGGLVVDLRFQEILRPSYRASGGRGIPGGGIMPARSFRITLSQTSG